MSLRRVTFSGRFAQVDDTSNESWPIVALKGVVAVTIDIVLALVIAITTFHLFKGNLLAPYERGFYCYQVPDLSSPFRPNTITSIHLLIVTLALPFLVISIVEAEFFRCSIGNNRLRKYFQAATQIYLEYLGGFTFATFIMESMKCAFARLRPHYFSVCKPDWSLINCTDPNIFIVSAHCTGTDEHRIRIGRQSFPSGHSAAAIYFLTFLFFYLRGLVNASNNIILRCLHAVLVLLVGVWTLIVLVTRVTDFWHYPSDVFGGILLGLLCVYIPAIRSHSSRVHERRALDKPHHS